MCFPPPLVLHGSHRADEAQIAAHASAFVERLETYPDWAQPGGAAPLAGCAVPDGDRPRLPEP
jgi:glutathione-regulated potassium-efflux system ancillary protein KefF